MTEVLSAERINPGKLNAQQRAEFSEKLYWYKPGNNQPAHKQTFVRKVQSGQDIYVVGAGVYME